MGRGKSKGWKKKQRRKVQKRINRASAKLMCQLDTAVNGYPEPEILYISPMRIGVSRGA